MSSIVAYTDIESNSEPNIVTGGINSKAQNCAENNINSQNTAGDEGLDCHNSQDETPEQATSNQVIFSRVSSRRGF
jgi:hypothetical protein